ncbi:MAG: 4Fe-4S dicluster domain-containing protein [Fibrobacter sp.]|nr:4Fe-4S dicluster domain-containing protein [Fibrobacter sp.]
MSTLTIDHALCKKDHLCIKECPVNIFQAGKDGFPIINSENLQRCIFCGHCQAVCPQCAITLNQIDPSRLEKTNILAVPLDNISQIIKSRRSIRNFKKESLPRETINNFLNLCSYAPTGGNNQSVKWLFVESRDTMNRIRESVASWARTTEKFSFLADAFDRGIDIIFRGAPHLAIAYSGSEYGSEQIDCCIAASTLELLASSQGVGACWAGFFLIACFASYNPLIKILDLPEGNKAIAALMLGYSQHSFCRIPFRKTADVKYI